MPPNVPRLLAPPALAAALLLATATAADSATAAPRGYDRCPSGHFCLFSEYDGNGAIATFRFGSPNLADQNFDDLAMSYANNTDSVWCTYGDYNYSKAQLHSGWEAHTADSLWELHSFVSSVRKGQC
ncbi:peptidase inhibitor family I36 protein [Streptomyces sp. NPDC048629]|uniref:peptidase inhibitor family I36 protein n=1 Tax=Streptomyces sp. NPDC048629 TaxID=3154824 RepID=UPI00343DAAEE